jgi:hypothetical protein
MELAPTTGIETGANGSARVSYAPTCNLALRGSMEVVVTQLEGNNLCVQVFDRTPPAGGGFDGTGLALAAGGGLVLGGALFFGLGMLPISK